MYTYVYVYIIYKTYMHIYLEFLIYIYIRYVYLNGSETPNSYYFEGLKAQPAELWVQKQVEAAGSLAFQGTGRGGALESESLKMGVGEGTSCLGKEAEKSGDCPLVQD